MKLLLHHKYILIPQLYFMTAYFFLGLIEYICHGIFQRLSRHSISNTSVLSNERVFARKKLYTAVLRSIFNSRHVCRLRRTSNLRTSTSSGMTSTTLINCLCLLYGVCINSFYALHIPVNHLRKIWKHELLIWAIHFYPCKIPLNDFNFLQTNHNKIFYRIVAIILSSSH